MKIIGLLTVDLTPLTAVATLLSLRDLRAEGDNACPTRVRFSCGALRSVTIYQCKISIVTHVLFWMLKSRLACSMI